MVLDRCDAGAGLKAHMADILAIKAEGAAVLPEVFAMILSQADPGRRAASAGRHHGCCGRS
jgi:hypothetical protein